MDIVGPSPHRVYQRNQEGQAEISFEVATSQVCTGNVLARLAAADGSRELHHQGTMNNGAYAGIINEVPVGRYRLDIRVELGSDVHCATITPLFVGDLWLLAGQSNMVGAGKLIDIDQPQEGISCFYMGDRWGMAEEPLCWLNESLDPVNWEVSEERLEETAQARRRDRTEGAGLGLPFAKEVMLHTGIPIGLIMCAHGGTSMTDWDFKRKEEGAYSHYGAMLRKIRKLGGRVKGCLWYQGEAEAVLGPDHYARYGERMTEWVADLRREAGDPQLPFIYAQLSSFYILEPDATGWNRVQQEQLQLEGQLEHAAMVPTIDAAMSDMIHLDTPSLRDVGRRMARQALRIAYGMPISLPGPRPDRFEWDAERTELTIRLSGVNGALRDVERVFGFHAECGGQHQPLTAGLTDDGQGVRLRFECPVPSECSLWHGKGFYPVVNVRDNEGIPLVVFGPIQV